MSSDAARTGDPLWNAAVGSLLGQSPTVANGTLFVTSASSLTAFRPQADVHS